MLGPIIHAGNAREFMPDRVVVDGQPVTTGLIPRDYNATPKGCYAAAPGIDGTFPLIPFSEWRERIRDMKASKSRLSDIRRQGNNGSPIPSLDQNGKGYCWAHSTTHAVMLARAVANLPYVPLSAYAVACIIKGYRDEGGWGAQSLDFARDRGIPSQANWPQQSMSRTHDNAATWENAALHKVTEGFIDLDAPVYNRTMSWQQQGTMLLSRCPIIGDHNDWGHSICEMDLVDGLAHRTETRAESGKLATVEEFELIWAVNDEAIQGIGKNIWNSWADSWGNMGEGTLTGSHAVADSATSVRSSHPSVA